MRPKFFFDASALIGLFEERPGFGPYRAEPILTERGHIYEFVRYLLKTRGARDVLPIVAAVRAIRVEPQDVDLLAAAKLKAQHSRMSAQDALGYRLARREGLKFLTTDTAFRKMPGVELVE